MPEPKVVCPLGGKCKEIKDNVECICAWYVKLVGKDPQSEKTIDQWGCAMAWLPVMLVEVSQTNREVSAIVTSARDEIVKRQDVFNLLAAESVKRKKIAS